MTPLRECSRENGVSDPRNLVCSKFYVKNVINGYIFPTHFRHISDIFHWLHISDVTFTEKKFYAIKPNQKINFFKKKAKNQILK